MGSGLTVVTERLPHVRSVAIGFWVGIGSRDEAPAESGASHFLEHLLFKGTTSRSARDIAEAVDEVGGDLNAFTTKEYTAFEVRLLADHLDLGLDILTDIMWAPAFGPDDVEAERSVILEEILMTQDEPGDLVHDVFGAALFPGHPLGRPVLGTDDTVVAMGRDDISGFHASHYAPGQVVVAVAGDIDHDKVVDAVGERTPPASATGHPVRTPPDAVGERTRVVRRRTEQAHLVLGARAPGARDDDRYAVEVLNQALGGGVSSRLFQDIRERRGLAYSVYSYRCAFSDGGALACYAGTAPKNARHVVDLFHETLDALGADGLTDRELAVAKGQLRGSTLLGLEDTGARMGRLGRSHIVHGHVADLDEVLGRVEAVTAGDVARVAAALAAGQRTLAAIGPFDESAFA